VTNLLKNINAAHNYPESWFMTEFYPFTGFDIFSQAFDTEKGYTIYQHGRFDILCLQLEKLNYCYKEAFKIFMDVDLSELVTRNSSDNRSQEAKQRYKEVVDTLKVDESILNRLCESRYMKHFYSDMYRKEFVLKWKK
jgi:Putative capsular polysaccharide synthesis protein.